MRGHAHVRRKRGSSTGKLTLLFTLCLLAAPVATHARQPPPGTTPQGPSPAQTTPAPPPDASATPQTAAPPQTGPRTATPTPTPSERDAAMTDGPPSVTRHEIRVGSRTLRYTVTTGVMPLKSATGETEARIFYMAYTLDGVSNPAQRPLMFSFNGGPALRPSGCTLARSARAACR